jgi:hypothetical protein
MYTGKTEQPCCLCDDPDTDTRLDLPPRAVPEMKHGDPIAWRDIEGEVSIHFCADCWATVRELVLETGLSPLPRCNAARADFDLREDFEALLKNVHDEPDHAPIERRMREESAAVLEDPDDHSDRAVVEAWVVREVLADAESADTVEP